ncbi:hypothetical protein STEG23_033677, partial [Scotinomys teguina]
MQPGRTTNTGGGTMEVVAAAPRCQLLLIVLMAAMLLPGMKGSPLLVQRKITRTIKLQESIGKAALMEKIVELDSQEEQMIVIAYPSHMLKRVKGLLSKQAPFSIVVSSPANQLCDGIIVADEFLQPSATVSSVTLSETLTIHFLSPSSNPQNSPRSQDHNR